MRNRLASAAVKSVRKEASESADGRRSLAMACACGLGTAGLQAPVLRHGQPGDESATGDKPAFHAPL